MSEDPTSWYCWWAPLKGLGARDLWRHIMPQNLTPSQKQRRYWIWALILLVYVPLAIYIWVIFNRALGTR